MCALGLTASWESAFGMWCQMVFTEVELGVTCWCCGRSTLMPGDAPNGSRNPQRHLPVGHPPLSSKSCPRASQIQSLYPHPTYCRQWCPDLSNQIPGKPKRGRLLTSTGPQRDPCGPMISDVPDPLKIPQHPSECLHNCCPQFWFREAHLGEGRGRK